MTRLKQTQRVAELWLAFSSSVATAVFAEVHREFASGIHVGISALAPFALPIAALTAVVLFFLLVLCPHLLQMIRPIRNALFPPAKAEGFWFQFVDIDQRPYSVSWIRKEFLSGWKYSGFAYSDDFKLAASWSSRDIEFEADHGFWIFKGQSARYRCPDDGVGRETEGGPGNVISVLYWGSYEAMGEGAVNPVLEGRMTDIDLEDAPSANRIRLVRIVEEDWRAVKVTRPATSLNQTQMRALAKAISARIGG